MQDDYDELDSIFALSKGPVFFSAASDSEQYTLSVFTNDDNDAGTYDMIMVGYVNDGSLYTKIDFQVKVVDATLTCPDTFTYNLWDSKKTITVDSVSLNPNIAGDWTYTFEQVLPSP